MTISNAAPITPGSTGRLATKWKVLICVVFGIFMIILDSTVVNVALRTIQSAYGTSLTTTQWIVSIYVLALGIMTPMSGFLADRFGMKRIYLTGLSLFVIGSLLCGVSPFLSNSIWWLVAARALQGVGGGMAQPLAAAFIYGTFPPQEQGLALGYFGIALVVAPALGPILGGFLVDQSLWQWIFFINIPIGVLGVTLGSRWLPVRDRGARKPRADIPGLITSALGFGAILYAASEVSERGWGSSVVLTSFLIGAVSLAIFSVIELFVAKEPLLNLRLFGNPRFLVASLIGYVSVIALFGAEFLMPLYLQVLRGRTALQAGLILLPIAVASAFATPMAGRLYDKIGPRPLVVLGFLLLSVNTWNFSRITASTPISTIVLLLLIRGLGLGLTVQSTFATALSSVPRSILARGSSLINGTRFVVQSIGVAVLATVLTSGLSTTTKSFQSQSAVTTVQGAPAQVSAPTDIKHFGLCESITNNGQSVTGDQNLPPQAIAQIKTLPTASQATAQSQIAGGIEGGCSEYIGGFERAYNLSFVAALVAVILAFFLPGWPLKWAGRTAAAESPLPAGH